MISCRREGVLPYGHGLQYALSTEINDVEVMDAVAHTASAPRSIRFSKDESPERVDFKSDSCGSGVSGYDTLMNRLCGVAAGWLAGLCSVLALAFAWLGCLRTELIAASKQQVSVERQKVRSGLSRGLCVPVAAFSVHSPPCLSHTRPHVTAAIHCTVHSCDGSDIRPSLGAVSLSCLPSSFAHSSCATHLSPLPTPATWRRPSFISLASTRHWRIHGLDASVNPVSPFCSPAFVTSSFLCHVLFLQQGRPA